MLCGGTGEVTEEVMVSTCLSVVVVQFQRGKKLSFI